MAVSVRKEEPDISGQPDLPVSLSEWREWVLNGILRVTFAVWVVALMAGVYSVIQSNAWQERPLPALILVGSYLLAAVVMGIITFRREYSFKLRSSVILATVYALGAVGIGRTGYGGDGRLFLFTFIAMTAIFYDLRRSLFALALSVLTIAATAWLWFAGIITPAPGWAEWMTPLSWIMGGVVFLLLSVAMLLTVTFLIRSLDRSISDSRQERNFISAILETSGAMVVLFQPDGRIIRFNRACEQVTGYTFEEVQGKFVWDLFLTPGGIELTKTVFQRVQEGDEVSAYECHWLTKSRSRRLIAWSTTALRDQTGDMEYIVSTGIDITVHQEVEAERERLLAAEHEQRLLAETLTEITLALTSQTSPTAVLDEILQRARRVVPFKTANILLLEGDTLRSARWQGYDTFGGEEAIANFLQPLNAVPLEERIVKSRQPLVIHDTRQEPLWIALEGMGWVRSQLIVPIVQQARVLGLLRLDGNTPGEFSAEGAERLKPLVNAAAIALERARLHQETMRQAQRVQQILDSAQDGIVLLDSSFRVELANPAAQEYLTVLADGMNGKPVTKLADQPLTKLIEPPPAGMSGHEVSVGKDQRRIFETAVHPLQTGTEAGGWVLVLREMTEARKQQQYAQAQERLAMVGQLAAGIAHDFNNIMTVIILYAQMLLKLPQFASDEDPRMATLFRQAKLAANLISQILDFSRQSVMERRSVNLVYFLKELLKMLKRTLPENISLDLIFAEREYGVFVDLTRLQQAVMNLAVNARDAMPDGGTLTIELDHIVVGDDGKPPLPDMNAGEWVMMAVTDTGTGIKAADLDHVFEPFFTTKAPGKGTGLGLAQVYGIVKQHGGFIDLSSVEGEGTTFRIYLPYRKLEDSLEPALTEEIVAEGGGETILVVEDDENTLEAVCEILRTLNYYALPASNGAQALEIFERRYEEIALVISDMVMPAMSGSKLYTKLRDLKPDIKMVIITGYPFEEQDRALLSQGIVAWVQKPFVMEQIASAIQEALVSGK